MSFRPVSVQACSDYEESTVRQSMDRLLSQMDALSFVKPGMTIAIKVNLISAMKPEDAATTHPALVKDLCRRITEKGARAIVGDSPGGVFSAAALRPVYQKCGLTSITEVGGTLNDNFEVTETFDADAKVLNSFPYTSWLDDADAIINFCKLKTHAMMGMTCAVKNMFGTIPGTAKAECHMRFKNEDQFADMLIDLNEHFKPRLYIVDAVDGMEGNGPTAGTPRHIGCLLAGRSPYELDAVCADIIGMGPDRVPTLHQAIARGLGPESGSQVTILGDPPSLFKISDFNISSSHMDIHFGSSGIRGKIYSSVLKATMSTRPQVHPDLCIGCGKCGEVCPAHAITMNNKLPAIDRDVCIRCFCCQEFCPQGAMRVHRSLPGRIVQAVSYKSN